MVWHAAGSILSAPDETHAFPTLLKPLTSLHSCYDTVSALELHHAGQIGSSALAPAPRACISAGIRNANADTPAPSAHAFAAPRGALSPPQAAGLDKAHTTTLATAGLAVLE